MHLPTRQRRPKDHVDLEVGHRRVFDTFIHSVRDLLTPNLIRRLFWTAEFLLLAGTLVAAACISRPEEWSPPLLLALLLALALVGEWFSVEVSEGKLSASLVAIVLAMGLARAGSGCGLWYRSSDLASSRRRLRPPVWLNNLTAFAVVPFAGGLMVRALAGDVHDARNQHLTQSVIFGLIVFGVFIVTLGLNFVLFGLEWRIKEGRSLPAPGARSSSRCSPASSRPVRSRRSSRSPIRTLACRRCSARSWCS